MPATKLKSFLDEHHIKYISFKHPEAFTAQEIAESIPMSGKDLAKTVILKVDGKCCMAVLPANRKVVIQDLRDLTGKEKVDFATEEEFNGLFPDCEPGAMPPLGNLYDMDVYVAPTIAEQEEIVFSAGTHTEVIRMAYRDFVKLVKPKVVAFTT